MGGSRGVGDAVGVGPVSRELLTPPSKVGQVWGSVGGVGVCGVCGKGLEGAVNTAGMGPVSHDPLTLLSKVAHAAAQQVSYL